MIFAWDDWNRGHIAEHGLTLGEAEYVVVHAADPFPRELGHGKYVVWGQGLTGRFLQVIFVYRSEEEVDFESVPLEELMALSNGVSVPIVYVIHAMPMTKKMLMQYRRLRR